MIKYILNSNSATERGEGWCERKSFEGWEGAGSLVSRRSSKQKNLGVWINIKF